MCPKPHTPAPTAWGDPAGPPAPRTMGPLRIVTGAMAVEILAAHIPAADGTAALAQVHAEHAVLYAATEPVTPAHPAGRPS